MPWTRAHPGGTLAVAVAALLAAPAVASAADPPLLYLMKGPAAAAADALRAPTLRQAPLTPDGRWPAPRVVGKVRGGDLANAGSPGAMAAILRAGWRQPNVGGLVAIDEITPNRWSPSAARALAAALASLGQDANRVMFYAAPALTERVGRADPRTPLPSPLGELVDAVSRGRATYLLTYHGDLAPFSASAMAVEPTRWTARWPAGRGELRLMMGPDGGLGQAEVWRRARSTAAGRALLANGPAVYGLRTAAEARAWIAQYRSFLGAPSVSATGADAGVPQPGGLTLAAAGANRMRIRIDRPGRAVVTLTRAGGGARRVIRKLSGPLADTIIGVPVDTVPGRYLARAVLIGNGLKDRAATVVRVTRRR